MLDQPSRRGRSTRLTLRRTASWLTKVSTLSIAFLILTVAAVGELSQLDASLHEPWLRGLPDLRSTLRIVDKLGQRAVCLPILFVVAAVLAIRRRRWRPVVIAVSAVLVLNLVVGLLKLLLGRNAPKLDDPSFFEAGVLYPSGHSANVVLVYGLVVFLLWRFVWPTRRFAVAAAAVVAGLLLVMVATSLLLGWHWFTDLVAGALIGGAILRATVTLDREVPGRPAETGQGRRGSTVAAAPMVSSGSRGRTPGGYR